MITKTVSAAFFVILGLFSSLTAIGQYDADVTSHDSIGFTKRKMMASDAIQTIKKGVLIIRLTSNARKIEELDKMIAKSDLSEKQKERFVEMRASTLAETEEENFSLIESFVTFYDFSDVLFMYDSSFHSLKAGIESGYFLNADNKIDPAISLAGRPFLLARYDNPQSSSLKQKKCIVVMDINNDDIPKPFPYSGDMNVLEYLLHSLRKNNGMDKYDFHVDRINNKMFGYYEKCRKKGLID